MVVIACDGSFSLSHSLRLAAHQPSKRHHAQSLVGPSLHGLRTPYVLESHPVRASPLLRLDGERRHAVGSHSALGLRLYLAACKY